MHVCCERENVFDVREYACVRESRRLSAFEDVSVSKLRMLPASASSHVCVRVCVCVCVCVC